HVVSGAIEIGCAPPEAMCARDATRSALLQMRCDIGDASASNDCGSGTSCSATMMTSATAPAVQIRYARDMWTDIFGGIRERRKAARAQIRIGGRMSGTNAASMIEPNGRGSQITYTASNAMHARSAIWGIPVDCSRVESAC